MAGAADRRIAVVGAGIAGLAAAWHLSRSASGAHVVLLEGATRLGGKLAGAELLGLPIDTAADRLLAHRPEAVDLVAAVGLGERLVEAVTAGRQIVVDGVLRPAPSNAVAGIPTDLTELARLGILDAGALARMPLDHVLPATDLDGDVSVGRYVGERLGVQAVDRLVAPPLRAIHVGDVTALSLQATMPRLYGRARTERSLLAAARRLAAEGGDGPRYLGLAGGLAALVPAIADALTQAGAEIRTRSHVRGLARMGRRWVLTVGSAAAPEHLEVDGVVLAVPAPAAARLLADVSLGASVHLAEIEYAAVATVALAYRSADLRLGAGEDRPGRALPGAGFWVPPSEPRRVIAAEYLTTTWDWLARRAGEHEVVRVLLGGVGRTSLLQVPDPELAELAHQELGFLLRLGRARPVASTVTRWGGALPQYTVGHAMRVRAIRESIATLPGLAVCGAAYDGTGVAACIASAERAVADLDVR